MNKFYTVSCLSLALTATANGMQMPANAAAPSMADTQRLFAICRTIGRAVPETPEHAAHVKMLTLGKLEAQLTLINLLLNPQRDQEAVVGAQRLFEQLLATQMQADTARLQSAIEASAEITPEDKIALNAMANQMTAQALTAFSAGVAKLTSCSMTELNELLNYFTQQKELVSRPEATSQDCTKSDLKLVKIGMNIPHITPSTTTRAITQYAAALKQQVKNRDDFDDDRAHPVAFFELERDHIFRDAGLTTCRELFAAIIMAQTELIHALLKNEDVTAAAQKHAQAIVRFCSWRKETLLNAAAADTALDPALRAQLAELITNNVADGDQLAQCANQAFLCLKKIPSILEGMSETIPDMATKDMSNMMETPEILSIVLCGALNLVAAYSGGFAQ